MLGNLRISSKLMVMVVLAVLGITTVALVELMVLRSNLLEDRKSKLQDVVELARQALERDYGEAKAAGLPDAKLIERSRALLKSLRFGQDDYLYALDMDGVVQVHPSPKVEGKNLIGVADSDGVYFTKQEVDLVRDGKSGFVSFRFPRAGAEQPLPKVAYVTEFKPYHWAIGGGIYIDDVDAIFRAELMRTGALIAVALLLVVGMSLLLGRSIVGPITAMTTAMRSLAGGDTAADVPARHRGDEVGAMAQSVQVFKESMIEAARLRAEQDALKAQSEESRKALLARMADEFQSEVRGELETLAQAANEMRAMAQSMAATAEATNRQAGTVAAAAGEATCNVQTVAAATEELSSSVAEIGRQVTQSTTIAGKAVAEAERTNATVQGLSAAAQKIGDVVNLISDIASQTNLLALNATIEAARAGEAGRGFAVVANEVKSLASQTARATEEISAQVAAMQQATGQAVAAIGGIGGTISEINEIATTIASAVEEQGAATREIARNVQQAALGTGQVSETIIGVNAAAGETGTAAGHVLASADELSRRSDVLRTGVDGFIARIRAA